MKRHLRLLGWALLLQAGGCSATATFLNTGSGGTLNLGGNSGGRGAGGVSGGSAGGISSGGSFGGGGFLPGVPPYGQPLPQPRR